MTDKLVKNVNVDIWNEIVIDAKRSNLCVGPYICQKFGDALRKSKDISLQGDYKFREQKIKSLLKEINKILEDDRL